MTWNLKQLSLVAALFTALSGVNAGAETITLKAGRYLDVARGRMIAPALIIIEDSRILAINPAAMPEVDRIIDLGELTLLPGLMDAHTHLTMELSSAWQHSAVTKTAGDFALLGSANAQKTLMAGFTTVRDLGAPHFADVAVAHAIDNGMAQGPHLIAAAHGTGITGGHCDATGYAPGVELVSYRTGIGDGPDELIKAIRYQIKHGARVVKICATSGVMSHEQTVGAQQTNFEELKAAAEEAHRHNLKIAAHAVGEEGIIAAAKAGIDSIEHASLLTPTAAKAIKQNGAYVVHTLYLLEAVDPASFPPEFLKKGMLIAEASRESFKLALKENLKIVFGTDAGVIPHGLNAKEFSVRVRLGQQPLEAIRSATLYASELLNVPDRGQITAGFQADIIAVDGDPLADISRLEDVKFVMKEGQIYKEPVR
ncbi:MAG: hypothetical protein DCC73_06650 [Proteobacteria bacterium]|nr:MAG: hypothetical protein DCC73_06650 [Pseudomonadota bacterium]